MAGFGRALIYCGGIIAFMNLIPLSSLDGAILWKSIFASMNQKQDMTIAGGFISISLVFLARMIFFTSAKVGILTWVAQLLLHIGPVLFIIFLIYGLIKAQQSDNPEHHRSPLAMSYKESIFHALLYGSMVIAAFVLF